MTHKTYTLEIIESLAKQKVSKHPLIFIHGAAGGAWYFKNYLSYFSEHGYNCYALSLRGHGLSEGYEDIDTFRLLDYVEDVRSLVLSLDEKPILIGHSMGGAITQSYIGLYQDEIEMAILLSSAQAGGISPDSPLGLFFSDSRAFLRKLRKNENGKKITLDDVLNQTVFSNRFDEDELKFIKKRLVKESNFVKKDLLSPYIKEGTQIDINVVVIGSKDDHIIGLNELITTAKFFNTKPIILNHLCHFLTIDKDWLVAAQTILNILKELQILKST